MDKQMFFRLLITVLALLLLAHFGVLPAAAQTPPGEVMAAMFSKHADFDCVRNGFQVTAREPSLDAFAQQYNLNADQVQCFFYTWEFDRGVNALNQSRELGSGVAKGHYVNRGVPCPTDATKLCLSPFDLAALHASDINEVVYELGGMPEFNYISNGGYPVSNRWVRYPTRFLRYSEIPY